MRDNLRDPAFRACPHPILDTPRAESPLYEDEALDRVLLTRAAHVAAVFADRRLSCNPAKGRPDCYARSVEVDPSLRMMAHLDGEDHARLRGPVAKAFTACIVEALRPRIETSASSLLDASDASRSFELIAACAAPLPILVIAIMPGIDEVDAVQWKIWSNDLIVAQTNRSGERQDRLTAAYDGLNGCDSGTAAARREQPRDDLISALVLARNKDDKLSEAKIVNNRRLSFAAGHVTLSDLMGNDALALLHHPAQIAQLRGNLNSGPRLSRNGFVTTSGVSIKKHFSFGGGAHFCLGASLGRLEGQLALHKPFMRFPDLRLLDAPKRRTRPSFNGFETTWLSPV